MDNYKYRSALETVSSIAPSKNDDAIMKENNLKELVHLGSNENAYGSSPVVKAAMIKALDIPSLYPDMYCTDLRRSLSQKNNIDMDELIFGCGTDEIIYFLGKAFIEPDDEVITAEITFASYSTSVETMGGKMVLIPMKDYGFDLDKIAEAITPKTKMIVLVNPNNPTGTVFREWEQTAFLKKVPKDVYVVIDEAYSEYFAGDNFPDTMSMFREYKNLILLKTFSKVYGLASYRVGYGIADKQIVHVINRVKTRYNVTVQAQTAANAALTDSCFVKTVVENNQKVLQYVYKSLDEFGFYYIPTYASFIMFDIKTDSIEVTNELLKKGYMIRPGASFSKDMATFLRVSIGTMEQMQGFMQALKEVLEK